MARRARDSKGRFKKKSGSRKRKSSKKSSRGKTTCKVISVCGKRRKVCWGPNGIKSNRPAGGGSTKKRKSSKKSSSKSSSGKTYAVSRSKATYSSGKKKGRLKPGCRFVKGGGARCTKKNP